MLRLALVTVALVGLATTAANAQDPALQRAVRSYDPALAWSTDVSPVRGDFNGDGTNDVAAVLQGADRRSLVVFHGGDDGYTPFPLYTRLPRGEVCLRRIDPGRYRVLGPQGAIELRHESVELVFPGRSSAIYAWSHGRYDTYGTERYCEGDG